MPACKHGAWDYCGQCLAEYALEQPVRVTQSPVEIVRESIPEQDEVARLTREINRLTDLLVEMRAERDAAWADAACQFERAESEYEIVDTIAKLLTEMGRPAEEEIADGVRWLIADRDRLRALLREWLDDATPQRRPWATNADGRTLPERTWAVLEGRDA